MVRATEPSTDSGGGGEHTWLPLHMGLKRAFDLVERYGPELDVWYPRQYVGVC